jgi:hypothetical protein
MIVIIYLKTLQATEASFGDIAYRTNSVTGWNWYLRIVHKGTPASQSNYC